MIKSKEALSMSEALEYLKGKGSEEEKARSFIQKFVKLNPKDAKEMKEKLAKLDLMKMKSEQIVKVIDILPEDKEDLNKIFANVNLDEDETKKILDPVKEYK
ncbi:hypothetical protein CMI44_01425 [Candidatus Pacearchaeota archaeon]|nr:hypothetical protein [Candidatus Pacearchaeota archaeon]|tara:strand:+ start:888 stop:1193 length:306 start_codon:yes stop_codon:yes gene_type:complete